MCVLIYGSITSNGNYFKCIVVRQARSPCALTLRHRCSVFFVGRWAFDLDADPLQRPFLRLLRFHGHDLAVDSGGHLHVPRPVNDVGERGQPVAKC